MLMTRSFARYCGRYERSTVGGRQALWSDFGSRASGFRGRTKGECGDATTVDAGGGPVEPRAEGAAASSPARAQGALWRDGADGRELSSVAGRARANRLLDGHCR